MTTTSSTIKKGKDNDDDVVVNGEERQEEQEREQEEQFCVLDENGLSREPTSRIKILFATMGMMIGFIMLFIEIVDNNKQVNQTLSVAIWMATLWLTETIPHTITALIPLFVFPLFGILDSNTVAIQYFVNLNWLFISGFIMSLTLERWNIHKRISLLILTWCGNKPRRLLFGIMFCTFFFSMFISNTATSLMMVTNGVSICKSIEENTPTTTSTTTTTGNNNSNNNASQQQYRDENRRFGIAVMLGIAYAANIGGLSSLIGTGPNLAFARQLGVLFPESPEITFAEWWFIGLPIGLLIFFIIWGYLSVIYLRNFQGTSSIDERIFVNQYIAMGPWSWEQIMVAVLFALLSFLWVFRGGFDFGTFQVYGWTTLFPDKSYITDTTIGMFIGVILLITPARASMLPEHSLIKYNNKQNGISKTRWTTLTDWDTVNSMPYDIIILLGGGFALAEAFVQSGLSEFLGEKLAQLQIPQYALIFVMIFLIIWLTELTSNTSTSNIMIPIAGSLAVATESSPYVFMIPATMACSCAFFLPIATPPNMVVFSTGLLPLQEMNKAGVVLNVLCAFILLAAAYTIIPGITGYSPKETPEWVDSYSESS